MESGCEGWVESREGFDRKYFKFRDFLGWCIWISIIVLIIISRDFQSCHCQIYPQQSNKYFNPYGVFVDQDMSYTNQSESVSYPGGVMADMIRGRATTTPAPMTMYQSQGQQGWSMGKYEVGNRDQEGEVEDFGSQQMRMRGQQQMQGQQQTQGQQQMQGQQHMQGQQQMGMQGQQLMQGQQQMGMQGQQQMQRVQSQPQMEGLQRQEEMGMENQEQTGSESPYDPNQYHYGNTIEYESQLSPPLVIPSHTYSYGDFQEYHHSPTYNYPPSYHHKPPPPIRIPRRRLSWLSKKRRHIHDRFMAHMNQRRQSQDTQMVGGTTGVAANSSGETFLDGLMMPAAFVALSMLTMDILGRLFPFGSGRGGWKSTTTTTPPPKITKIEISPPRIPILSDMMELKKGFFDSIKKKKAHIHKHKKDKFKKWHDKFKNWHDKKKNSNGWSSSSEEDYVGRSPSGKRTSSKKKRKGEKKYPRYTWQRLQQLYNEQMEEQQKQKQGR